MVIAAPDWDMTFPAALKIYLEWTCTLGVTFHYTREGVQEGLWPGGGAGLYHHCRGPSGGEKLRLRLYKGAGEDGSASRPAHCLSAEGLDVREMTRRPSCGRRRTGLRCWRRS